MTEIRQPTPWVQIFGGGKVDLVNPEISSLYPLVRSIAGIRRFVGHTKFPIWVTVHSVAVARMVSPAAAPYALLHDLHEGVIGDIATPVKEVLGPYGRAALRLVTDRLDAAIWRCAGLEPPTPDIVAEVKRADLAALLLERRDSMHAPPQEWSLAVAGPLPEMSYTACSEAAGLAMFIEMAMRLLPIGVGVDLTYGLQNERAEEWGGLEWVPA